MLHWTPNRKSAVHTMQVALHADLHSFRRGHSFIPDVPDGDTLTTILRLLAGGIRSILAKVQPAASAQASEREGAHEVMRAIDRQLGISRGPGLPALPEILESPRTRSRPTLAGAKKRQRPSSRSTGPRARKGAHTSPPPPLADTASHERAPAPSVGPGDLIQLTANALAQKLYESWTGMPH